MIFEPVILQIIQLVQDQIRSSKVSIRAVLLVGGFGSSTYLRQRLRNALGGKIQIMQPPNAWLAVVNGAVMKGLALSAPTRLTQVKIENRVARRHYGTEWALRYDESKHASIKNKRWWCGLDGCFKVTTMNWFIKKVCDKPNRPGRGLHHMLKLFQGENVSENEAIFHSFYQWKIASSGRVRKVTVDLYMDNTNRPAVLLRDENVKLVCRVEADVTHIPENQLSKRKGSDGEMYYELECKLESVCTWYTIRPRLIALLTNSRSFGFFFVDSYSQGTEVQHCDSGIRLNDIDGSSNSLGGSNRWKVGHHRKAHFHNKLGRILDPWVSIGSVNGSRIWLPRLKPMDIADITRCGHSHKLSTKLR